MKVITKYRAKDGCEFSDKTECEEYETLISTVDEIMSKLPVPPENDGNDFSNGKGYLQHDKLTLKTAKLQLLRKIKKEIGQSWVVDAIEKDEASPLYVSRLIDEYCIGPLSSAWHRMSRIDKDFREWGKLYYAHNPEKGVWVRLNP